MTATETEDCDHARSLDRALNFLDQYHPVPEEKMSLVHGLRDQVRNNRNRMDVLRLADAVEGTTFELRHGVAKALPGLSEKIRSAAAHLA